MLQILKQISLKKFNTFGIEAVAENFIEVTNNQEIAEAIEWARDHDMKPILLGGGSNVLMTVPTYPLIILNRLTGIKIVDENADYVWVESGAGEVWHELVLHCIENGWGGIENLSLIPGTVGAAPMQNIGAYGVEITDVFESLSALNLSTLEISDFSKADCSFGYRESVFKKELKGQYFITSVTLKLSKQPKVNTSYGAIENELSKKSIINPSIKQVSDAVISIRRSKLPDPQEIGNAGSFFKNPVITTSHFEELRQTYPNMPNYPQSDRLVKIPAGWLIEQCGWKGKKEGEVGVHDKQALVLVNHGCGKGQAIQDLAGRIRTSVLDQFNVDIIPEVNII
ncbi:MAG: UDP-N-acetylmuramate dehydrogenase [Reichenbachiella sp.]|uniref:UDP-N-acetylmuramate dehydrogenase n=1 Tax=Reichenbachiella sp. TaxID=2184521 RepID=UPI00326457F7